MIAHRAEASRPRWFTAMRLAADIPTRMRCSAATAASCSAMATRPTRNSPGEIGRDFRDAGLLLEPRKAGLLRSRQGEGADRDETLQRIAALYEIEAGIRGKSAAARLAVRQTESKPLVTELRNWFEVHDSKIACAGPTADAIRYALNHWDGLCRFLDDGRIELDNK